MKCPICDGGGRITSLPSGMPVKCTRCNGTGKIVPTNEEWFGTLSTEEKAKTIVCLAVNSMHKRQKGLIDSDVGEIVRWLKAEHDSEEK